MKRIFYFFLAFFFSSLAQAEIRFFEIGEKCDSQQVTNRWAFMKEAGALGRLTLKRMTKKCFAEDPTLCSNWENAEWPVHSQRPWVNFFSRREYFENNSMRTVWNDAESSMKFSSNRVELVKNGGDYQIKAHLGDYFSLKFSVGKKEIQVLKSTYETIYPAQNESNILFLAYGSDAFHTYVGETCFVSVIENVSFSGSEIYHTRAIFYADFTDGSIR